jgi:hypothetical protein
MTYPKCNEEIPHPSKFCSNCGNKIQYAEVETSNLNITKLLNNKKGYKNSSFILIMIALSICIFFTSYFNKAQTTNNITASESEKIKVPNVKDMCLADAKIEIKNNKLLVGKIAERFDDNNPVGNIINQQPSEDTIVHKNTFVNLVISKGTKMSPEESTGKVK